MPMLGRAEVLEAYLLMYAVASKPVMLRRLRKSRMGVTVFGRRTVSQFVSPAERPEAARMVGREAGQATEEGVYPSWQMVSLKLMQKEKGDPRVRQGKHERQERQRGAQHARHL